MTASRRKSQSLKAFCTTLELSVRYLFVDPWICSPLTLLISHLFIDLSLSGCISCYIFIYAWIYLSPACHIPCVYGTKLKISHGLGRPTLKKCQVCLFGRAIHVLIFSVSYDITFCAVCINDKGGAWKERARRATERNRCFRWSGMHFLNLLLNVNIGW